jgi:hypothetical protein
MHEVADSQTYSVRNPDRYGLIPVAGLVGLFSLATLLAAGLVISGRWGHPLFIPFLVGTGMQGIFVSTTQRRPKWNTVLWEEPGSRFHNSV